MLLKLHTVVFITSIAYALSLNNTGNTCSTRRLNNTSSETANNKPGTATQVGTGAENPDQYLPMIIPDTPDSNGSYIKSPCLSLLFDQFHTNNA